MSIKKQVICLTSARLIESVLLFATPMVLTRYIEPSEFGLYRLFWLIVSTIIIIVPLGMPRSLLYFIPRLDDEGRNVYVTQTVLFLLVAGMFSALVFMPWNIMLPTSLMEGLVNENYEVISIFVCLWIFTHVFDFLPNALNKISFQAISTIVLALIRSSLVIYAAINYREIEYLIIAITISAIIKLLFLLYFLFVNFSCKFKKNEFKKQLNYAVPFGLSGTVYTLRKYGEQWIVAFLFLPSEFASFSLAAMILMPFNVISSSVTNVILPKMSLFFAEAKVSLCVNYNKTANLLISMLFFPLGTFVFVYSEDIVLLVFGEKYLDVIPVMRIYIVQVYLTLEVGSLISVLNKGKFNLIYNIIVLMFSLLLSYLFAKEIGLVGAAIGSVAASFLGYLIVFYKLSNYLNIRVRHLQYWKHLIFYLCLSWVSIYAIEYLDDLFQLEMYRFLKLSVIFCEYFVVYMFLLLMFGQYKFFNRIVSNL